MSEPSADHEKKRKSGGNWVLLVIGIGLFMTGATGLFEAVESNQAAWRLIAAIFIIVCGAVASAPALWAILRKRA
jgi:hypothetical protein